MKEKSPDTFDAHCEWLVKKAEEWERNQKSWDENSRRRMNYHFRKEIEKNTRLVEALAKKAYSCKERSAVNARRQPSEVAGEKKEEK